MNRLIIRMIPCECEWNCGILIPEFDKQGRKRRFVKGHANRGKILSPETKQLISENRTDKCCGENNPMYGKKHSPETKKLMSINHADFKGENHPQYGTHQSDATRQLMSIAKLDKYSGEKNPMFGKQHSPETKQKISKNLIGKCSGENHPNWKGGISKEPYCQEFDKWLKEEIKERDGFKCQNPDCPKTAKRLACHHIDYDKKNCSTDNLITLCTSCNSKANSNREYWKEFYKQIIGR